MALYESDHIEPYALNDISHGIGIHIRLARGGLSDFKNRQYSVNMQNKRRQFEVEGKILFSNMTTYSNRHYDLMWRHTVITA